MRRLQFLTLVGLAVGFLACDRNKMSTISGDLQSNQHPLEGKMIYLASADQSRNLVDSSRVEDGKFKFTLSKERFSAPVRTAILYRDDSHGGYLRRVGYQNPFYKNTVESAFYFDNKDVDIRLQTNRKKLINNEIVFDIGAIGSQTEVAFQHLRFKVGPGAYTHNMRLVKSHPNAADLVYQLNGFREKFSKEELKDLSTAFGTTARATTDFTELQKYVNTPEGVVVGEVKYILVED